MRAKTFAEHRIRARAAVQYPGWRVDFGAGYRGDDQYHGAQAYGDLPTAQETPRRPNHDGS